MAWQRADAPRTHAGALFGPPITKWFQFLGRLQFSTPAKAVAYRVRPPSPPTRLCLTTPTSHLPPSVCLQHGNPATPTSLLAETWITHEDRRHRTWRIFTTVAKELAVDKTWIAATHLAETP